MRLLSQLSHLAILVPLALVSARPDCSAVSGTPCSCPNGTQYQESATFIVIGAAATDVRNLLAPFLETSWFGLLPYKTTGTNYQPGATRSYKFPTSIGQYDITEQLTSFTTDPSGSFQWQFEQAPFNVPTEFLTKNGSFSGYWATFKSESIFSNETLITWSVYECATGHPLDFALFQQSSLANASKVLTDADLVSGQNVKPFSIQSFPIGNEVV